MRDHLPIERASVADARGIAEVHVASWRSAYPAILPDRTLLGLSAARLAPHYADAIRGGDPVVVARDGGRVVGFATGKPIGHGEGELETLYVLDDWRERGIGRALVGAIARDLARAGCRALIVHVLSDNPARWFYHRLGGIGIGTGRIRVGGTPVARTTLRFASLDRLSGPG